MRWGHIWQVAFCSGGGQCSEGVTTLTLGLNHLLENVSAGKRPSASSYGVSKAMAEWYESVLALLQFFFFLVCNCFAYLCKVDFESLGILWLWLDLSCIICSLLSVLSQIYHSNLCNNYIQFLLITFNQRCEVSCPMLSGRPVG